ncbi:MAG: 30S ribosome-binding factor RbfA [Anaerolineales bacterium]|nr:30S ribosome-binding factor RbfA [Anaerolineales bacterium]MCK4978675.1 30S ribosome-binding factor RbfA [Anaerolineales bacterium]
MVSKTRTERIANRIRDELSEMLIYEVSDPRLSGVSVTDVTVDRELAFADIYVSALEGNQRAEDILTGLEHARGYLRRQLAHRIDLRTFPQIRFHWDPTFERAENIDKLIASLHEEDDSMADQELGTDE